jgi:hypothetical protein
MVGITQSPNHAGFDFILVELDLAILCKLGLTTRDFSRAQRNADNARITLRTTLRARGHLRLSQFERELIFKKTSELASLLAQLELRLRALA